MCVLQTASFPRIFKLFRGLGLRHLVIVNGDSEASTIAYVEERIRIQLRFLSDHIPRKMFTWVVFHCVVVLLINIFFLRIRLSLELELVRKKKTTLKKKYIHHSVKKS